MRLDPVIIQQQIANLLLQFPELQEDEVLRADMIEGETEAFDFLSKIIIMIDDAKALSSGTKERLDELRARKDRFERRVEAYRDLAFKVMNAADLKKAELPTATLSIRNGSPKVVGEPDPAKLPDSLCKIERTVDRAAIKAALEAGSTVEGCELTNGNPSLAIRVK